MSNIIELGSSDIEEAYQSALAMNIVTSVVKSGSEDQFVDVFVVSNSPEFLGVLQDIGAMNFYNRSKLEKHEKLTILLWKDESEPEYSEGYEDSEGDYEGSGTYDWVNERYDD